MRRAGRDDENAVGDVRSVREYDAAAGDVDIRHVAEQYAHVGLTSEDAPQRRGDIGRRECARRHLIQQRLEQVKVAAIDERHADRRPPQGQGGVESAEPAADDHDVRA